MNERVAYDEFSMFHDNAAEYGIPFAGPPDVRREQVEVAPGRHLSALVWGDAPPRSCSCTVAARTPTPGTPSHSP